MTYTYVNGYSDNQARGRNIVHGIDPSGSRRITFGFAGVAACGASVHHARTANAFNSACKRCAKIARKELNA